jgi:hypothetical protein
MSGVAMVYSAELAQFHSKLRDDSPSWEVLLSSLGRAVQWPMRSDRRHCSHLNQGTATSDSMRYLRHAKFSGDDIPG